MNAFTVHLPDEIAVKMKALAQEQELDVDALLAKIMHHMIEQHDAEQRFRQYAEGGRGKEEEALALLRKAADKLTD